MAAKADLVPRRDAIINNWITNIMIKSDFKTEGRKDERNNKDKYKEAR